MPGTRKYRLLCPIARALDRVGDRWTLIILRDLHAGPARFSDLQTLPGIASNLLTSRLRQLEDDGFIRRRGAAYGTTVYELTELGSRTRQLLFELATLGARFAPDGEIKRPGNLRTIAVTLAVACQRVVDPGMKLLAELVVDDEPFTVRVDSGTVDVTVGAPSDPEARLATRYEPMIAVADGRMSPEEFVAHHLRLGGRNPDASRALAELMWRAIMEMNEDAP